MRSFRKNARAVLFVVLALFVALAVYFVYALYTYGNRWQTNPYNVRLQDQKSAVTAGDILDRNGTVLASTDAEGNRTYIDDKSTRLSLAHVIGDSYGLTGSGAESLFANYLLGMDSSLFERLGALFSGQKQRGSNVKLTVDAKLNDCAAENLSGYKGAVVVMNYKTGEILAMTSSPTFDLNDLSAFFDEDGGEAETGEDGALVNRATAGQYTPGSVFKIITAAAALRYLPNAQEMLIECGGPMAFDKEQGRYLPNVSTTPEEDAENKKKPESELEYLYVRDYQSSFHDELSLTTAFAKSCNVSFAKIGLELGADRVVRMAQELGVGVDFTFRDIVIYPSSIEKGKSDYENAWMSVGQYRDVLTPMNLCMITACIANDGTMMEPKLLHSVINSNNRITKSLTQTVYSTPLSTEEAQALQQLMVAVVESGTGTRAQIDGYTVGGKTGTAQVGSNVEDHAWFTGFVLSDDHPYAITVVVENGGSGGTVAAPIARNVLKKAIELD